MEYDTAQAQATALQEAIDQEESDLFQIQVAEAMLQSQVCPVGTICNHGKSSAFICWMHDRWFNPQAWLLSIFGMSRGNSTIGP